MTLMTVDGHEYRHPTGTITMQDIRSLARCPSSWPIMYTIRSSPPTEMLHDLRVQPGMAFVLVEPSIDSILPDPGQPRNDRYRRLDYEGRKAFLRKLYEYGGSIQKASEDLGIHKATIYNLRNADGIFNRAVKRTILLARGPVYEQSRRNHEEQSRETIPEGYTRQVNRD